jgi:hypothetical protein
MNILSLAIYTINVLGHFDTPFEFAGNYGEEINEIREKVFQEVVPHTALASHLEGEDFQKLLEEAILRDQNFGPTLGEVFTEELVLQLKEKQTEFASFGFSSEDLDAILAFKDKYKDKKIFRLVRSYPQQLALLQEILWSTRFKNDLLKTIPVLDSSLLLKGDSIDALKQNLLNSLFTEEIFELAKKNVKQPNFSAPDTPGLEEYLPGLQAEDLDVFLKTPAGRILYYCLYHSLILQLAVQDDPAMIEKINQVKRFFANTLGNSKVRAAMTQEKILQGNASVVFTQESDETFRTLLCENGFHPVSNKEGSLQNDQDGTLVFLKNDVWDRNYEVISIDPSHYNNKKGAVNIVHAVHSATRQHFLLAAAHGNSNHAKDGRDQIKLIKGVFDELKQTYPTLHLIIGTDANTKKAEDVTAFKEQLSELGLAGTSIGPTTFKQRYITMQHHKAGRPAIDEEDYIIVLKEDQQLLTDLTLGFQPYDPATPRQPIFLPSMDNPSDHFAVGATLQLAF